MSGAAKGALPIGGHHRLAGAAAGLGIALAASVLGDEPRAPLAVAARHRRIRSDQEVHGAGAVDAEQAESEPSAQGAEAAVGLAPAARPEARGEPNLVAGAGPVDALEDEFEVEPQLQLADHHQRRLVAAQGDEVATLDLTLHREAAFFQEALHRTVKLGLHPSGAPLAA